MAQSIERPLLLNESLQDHLESQNKAIQNSLGTSVNQNPSVARGNKESLMSNKSQSNNKNRRKFKIIQIISGVCFILALVIAFAFPPLLHMVIVQQAIDQVIFNPQSQSKWAHFPGDSGTVITRNFTFFNLTNEWNFVFGGEKPAFRQVSGYKIQQLQDFLNINYTQNGNKVEFLDWIRFGQYHDKTTKSLDDKVTILNMGNLGYWSTFKNARPTLVLQQGLALLFTNMEQSIIPTLLGSGLNQQFITNQSSLYSNLLAPAGITIENRPFMWNDPVYGFNNEQNLGTWAIAAINCFETDLAYFTLSKDANLLKNHFALSDYQIKSLMTKIYKYVTSLRRLLLENHYCADIDMSNCTGRYLGIAQIADGWVTGNTPPVATTSPNDTICDNNVTCKGKYPELYAFSKNIKTLNNKLNVQFQKPEVESQGYKFNRETVLKWLNYNHTIRQDIDYNTAQDCLLHIGNLDALWQIGVKYQKSRDVEQLQPMRERFGLNNTSQTLIFWKWLRYLHQQFVTQNAEKADLGIANLFTAGLYKQFSYLKDNLQRFLLAKKLKLQLSQLQCHVFFRKSLDETNQTIVNNLCHKFVDINTDQFAFFMVDTCQNKGGSQWTKLKQQMGVKLISLQNLCDVNTADNIGSRLHTYKIQFDSQYNCSVTPNPYCSNFQLALLQWEDSKVTLNLPSGLQSQLATGFSFNSWDPKAKKIQYSYFRSKFDTQTQKLFPRYSLEQLYKNFNFEGWFSTNGMLPKIRDNVFGPQFQYIRYVCIYITLGGFTASHTARQYMFGYYDEYLQTIRTQYPPFGGDPSAPSYIHFNDLNITKEQASDKFVMRTGKDDYTQLNQFYEINGFRYLTNQYLSFNGSSIIKERRTPWKQNDYFYGTSGKMFAPNQFQSNNLSILIPNIQRYGGNFFKNQTTKTQRFGQQVYLSMLSSQLGEIAPHNDKYYQTIANVFNSTSIYGLPLYITKNHFRNCTEYLSKVDIYIEDTDQIYTQTSHYDENFILIEPYTGVSFQSFLYLQSNYYHQQDKLYSYATPVFLPMFTVARSGNLTEDKYHQLFDPLTTGLKVQSSLIYVGISLGVVCLGVFVFATIKKRRIDKEEPATKDSQLGISLQEQHLNKSIAEESDKENDKQT